MLSIESRIAKDIAASEHQVDAAIKLLDEGATVPFIARYRKEITGGLDDTQLRHLEERLGYLRELEERRSAILASIEEQGKMTPELKGDILAAESPPGRFVPALQTETSHQSANRARSRA
jgi:protein Tex